jgi:hypothetical protein
VKRFKEWGHEWSKVVTYLLIISFGLYSTIYPIVSLERSAPTWAELLLGAEFVVAGTLLLAGMGRKRGYRLAGLVVVALGLFTISFVIAVAGGARVLAYAFLFGAFAMDSVHDLRIERRGKREGEDPEELRRLLLELRAAQRERNGR